MPILDRTGCAAQQGVLCGKNYATGYDVERNIIRQDIISKNSVSSLLLRCAMFMRPDIPLARLLTPQGAGCAEVFYTHPSLP